MRTIYPVRQTAAFFVTFLMFCLLSLLLLLAGCQQSKPGAATKLAFGTQPTTTQAGANISPAVTVRVLDANGRLVTAPSTSVTLALADNLGGATLSGTLTVTAVNGVATFPVLSVSTAGSGYTLRATSGSLTPAVSARFDVTGGAPVKLGFITQPGDTPLGATITPAVRVAVQDAAGNTITTGSYEVHIVFILNPTGTPLLGTLTRTTAGGIAIFDDLAVGKIGTGYKLYAYCSGLISARSTLFNITAGPPAQLAFAVQPGNTAAGAAIAPAVTVRVLDADGNPVTTATNAVTLAIDSNPGGGTLSGTVTKNAVNGVATFNDLSIEKAGAGYTLRAAATGLTAATSSAFTISAGAAAQLAFGIQPTNTPLGDPITPAVTVSVRDAFGNPVSNATNAVTLALAVNPGGAALAGTKTRTAVGGTATFDNLSLDKMGAGYALRATATGLTSATSAPFDVTMGRPAKLAFVAQPQSTQAGAVFTPAVTVQVQDALGNPVTNATNAIRLEIGANPGNGTLSGTATRNAVNGLATFDDLSIEKVGSNYTLRATADSLAEMTSAGFDITAGTPARVVFVVQPSSTVQGTAVAPAVTVQIQDTLGNLVPSATNAITVAIQNNPAGGTLSGTVTKNAVGGIATFSNLSINRPATGYTLRAIASGLLMGASSPFNILTAPPSKLAFDVQPGNTTAGDTIAPAVTVLVQDALGNTVVGAITAVTLAIDNNPGEGTLFGTVTKNAIDGVATFDDLAIEKAGAGYTLSASAGGLTGATSTPFTISAGAPAQLAFGTQPTNTPAGEIIAPPVTVRVQDNYGNAVTSATNAITLALGANPGGGVLSGTLTKDAVSGTATFNDLHIDSAGNGYTLIATAAGLTSTTSDSFDIGAPPPGILDQYDERLQAISIPPITQVAEAIVTYQMSHPEMKIRYGWPLESQKAFSDEFIARSGSLINWDYYHPAPGEVTNDVMICAVRSWEEDAAVVAAELDLYRQHGYKIVLIASNAGMPPGLPYDYLIDNGAATGSAEETRVNMLVNVTIGWLWQCEYVAACTRMLGAHPGIYMSAELPGGNEFDAELRENPTRMYPTDAVIPTGELAGVFKGRLDWLVGQLRTGPIQGQIDNAADIIANRMMLGQRVGLTAWTHCIPFEMYHAMQSPFSAFDCWNYTTAFKANMQPGDLVVFFGYSGMKYPPNVDGLIHEAELDLIPSYRPVIEDPSLNASDPLVELNQHWLLGDAEVPLPFAPDKMAPMSVIDGLLIMRMLDEAVKQRRDQPTTLVYRSFTSQEEFDDGTRDRGIDTTSNPGAVQLAPVDYVLDDVGNKIAAASASAYQGKKIFLLDEPQASGATVYIFRGAVEATFNGTPITFTPVEGNRNWFAASIAPALLQAGENELLMTSGCLVPVDTENDAGRSFISLDDGESWQAAPGEFLAHLCLNRYPSQGTITSEVLDLLNLNNSTYWICPNNPIKGINIVPDYTIHEGIDDLRFEVRAGNTPRPDATWTAWRPSIAVLGRYVQWRATLTTTDHRSTPELRSVMVNYLTDFSQVNGMGVTTIENQRIRRSSFPYTYQPPSGKLAGLRATYDLDAVVAPGATEMEKFTLLQQWVRKQWPNNEGSCLRPWDAVEILGAPAGDHGMCTHFATVFVQCALALGYNARHTVLMHHCVAEVWSNEYQKWVLIDEEAVQPEGYTRYGTAQYWRDGVPLNALEIHRAWDSNDTLGITQRLYMSDDGGDTFQQYDRNYPASEYTGNYTVFMHPKRNNHLDEREPWEEAQGWDYYHSNDYYFWSDGPVPDYSEFSSFSCREADNYWTLNQAQVTLTATEDPGTLAVSVVTETPNFKEFRYRLNGGAWQTLAAVNCGGISEVASYTWNLAVGANTLEIAPRNTFDQDGIVTTITITRAP